MMFKSEGYSIWMMPAEPVYNKMKKLISKLSKENKTPDFEPHVTLLSHILSSEKEILLKTEQLASIIKPFNVKLGKVEYGNFYNKCIFSEVKKTKELLDVNAKAKQFFNRLDDKLYTPHVSLLYGDLPVNTKEKIIKEIGKIDATFNVATLALFSTSGTIDKWYKIKDFLLK